jgi:predicted acetyltransferase
VAITIRNPRDDERTGLFTVLDRAFGGEASPAEAEGALAASRKTMPLERIFGAYEDDRPVGVSAAWPFALTVPGGELACGGVTWVGVVPTHRRRGLARELMRRQLDDQHERGEPLAALWASESGIYGRYGFGMAALACTIDADRAGFAYRDDPGAEGRVRLVDREEALELIPAVYDRVRAGRAGMLSRSADWWAEQRLATYWDTGDAGTRFHAVLELDGSPEGYAIYRIKVKWEDGIPDNTVSVGEALGTSSRATREVWRFLFSIDLTTRVSCRTLDPVAPLFLGVADPRRLRSGYGDGLWLRLVDVDAALRARSWNGEDTLVAEVRDAFCPWNDGRHLLGAGPGRADGAADLSLDVADLASLYLGGIDPGALHAAGRIDERTPGAVERAAALFRTPLPPFCPEVF